ncbi:hypothetical protein EMA8858_02986 [Emticicia aquatica]|jgi:hypothetical protein|uniref:YD repeat-containing protein n=1 Tax=Emticicia aquatica TaxID=1681835 RepID=A0ABN8EZQ0_9BACT|nr:hypothetical protein [Emticicia aquatica]CAH0996851.1 hypothetical protein EMA8858_02986 [Emticicia aquatica]
MKFVKLVLSFFPLLASAQANLQTVTNCPELQYTFYRQGQVEQQFTKTYDEQGRILTQNNAFSSRNTGNYTEEYTYDYDASGNNNTVTYKRNGEVNKVTKRVFDATGKLSKESISSKTNLISVNTPTNNGSENIQIFYDQDGQTETIREMTSFNTRGQLLKKEVKNPSGNILFSDTKTYNFQGKVSQEVHFDATDNVTTQTDFIYDGKGNLLSDKTLRNNVVFAETKNEYDVNGKLLKKTRLNSKGSVDYYFTYEYDTLGNLIKENYFYNNVVISIRTFEYDSKGNKTKESYFDKAGNVSMYKVWAFGCK